MYDRLYTAKISDQALGLVIGRKTRARLATKNGHAHSFVCYLRQGAQIKVYGKAGILVNRVKRLPMKRLVEVFNSLARQPLSRVTQGGLLELPHKGSRRSEVIKMYSSARPKIVNVISGKPNGTMRGRARVLKVAREMIIKAYILRRTRDTSAFIRWCVQL